MSFQKVLALPLAVALLVGCSGGNVSSSSDQNQDSSTGVGSIIERTKDLFKSKSNKMMIETTVSALIVEASKEWAQEKTLNVSINYYASLDQCNYTPELIAVHGQVTKFKSVKQMVDQTREILDKKQRSEWNAEEIETDKVLTAYARVEKEGYFCARKAIIASANPISGWVDANKTYRMEQAVSMIQFALVSNSMQTMILERLGDVSNWKNDVDVKAKVNKIINELVDDGSYSDSSVAAAKIWKFGHLLFDTTGQHASPVHFQISDLDFAGAGNGITVLKSGSPFFGDGYISGKKYTVSVESAESTTMKKSKTLQDKSETNSGQTVADSAGVAN